MDAEAADLLTAVCSRWVYGSVLPFALSTQQREHSRFEYDWRVFQIEYSRNYIFISGRNMEQLYNGLIDRNRCRLDVKEVKTIFGVRGRPHKRLRNANEPRGRRDTTFKERKRSMPLSMQEVRVNLPSPGPEIRVSFPNRVEVYVRVDSPSALATVFREAAQC